MPSVGSPVPRRAGVEARRAKRRGLLPSKQAYPVDTSAALAHLVAEFDGTPLAVSFRDLVSWIRVGERGTHYLHSYPAKLLPQIAHFFMAASSLDMGDDLVLDPFGGTGTVALEAQLSGKRAYYADANPLARLIASAKTKLLPAEELLAAFATIQTAYRRSRVIAAPDVVNLDYWYDPAVIRTLCRLKAAILGETAGEVRDFFLVTFSAVARRTSRADRRFSVPVRAKTEVRFTPADVWHLFKEQFQANLDRQDELRAFASQLPEAQCVGFDARSLRQPSDWHALEAAPLTAESVSLVVTSPPYAGAQKYVRASSLSLGWLGLTGLSGLSGLEQISIGREHLRRADVQVLPVTGLTEADAFIENVRKRNERRAAIIATYLVEMRQAFAEVVRTLRPGGHLVLVIGDNTVCGETFSSSIFLAEMLAKLGLDLRLKVVDGIRSRGLLTKRHKTADIIAEEW